MTTEEFNEAEHLIDLLEKELGDAAAARIEMHTLLEELKAQTPHESNKGIIRALAIIGVTGFVCLAVTYIAAAFAIFWG